MILRVWNAWTDAARAERYVELFRTSVGPHLCELPGFQRAKVATRPDGELVMITTILDFDDLASIEAFAGTDLERANVSDAARELLVRFDERVQHFAVRLSIGRAETALERSRS